MIIHKVRWLHVSSSESSPSGSESEIWLCAIVFWNMDYSMQAPHLCNHREISIFLCIWKNKYVFNKNTRYYMNFKSEPWQVNDKVTFFDWIGSRSIFLYLRVKLTFNHVTQICFTTHTCGKQVKMLLVNEFKCIILAWLSLEEDRRLEFFQTSHQQNVKETSSNRHMVVYSVHRCRTTCSCLVLFYLWSQLHAWLCIGTKLTTLLGAKLRLP